MVCDQNKCTDASSITQSINVPCAKFHIAIAALDGLLLMVFLACFNFTFAWAIPELLAPSLSVHVAVNKTIYLDRIIKELDLLAESFGLAS
jgi:hypothetical protein